MKSKSFFPVLILEVIACIAFCLLQMHFSTLFSTMIAFPFEQIGWCLRTLSLSGPAGNIAAIIIYIAVSLIPCAAYCFLKRKHRTCSIDLVY